MKIYRLKRHKIYSDKKWVRVTTMRAIQVMFSLSEDATFKVKFN